MEVMPLPPRYGCELGTLDVKAYHGCHETGEKEREKGHAEHKPGEEDQVDRCKRTESRQADYRDQNAVFNTGPSAPFLSREERAGRRRDRSSLAHRKAQPRACSTPPPLQ